MESKKAKPDAQRKRADIMQKAMKLFIAKGFEGTSTSEICLAAKLTKPSLYHYFESKNHLLYCVHMRAIEQILHPLMKEVSLVEEPVKRLEVMIRECTKAICSHPELRFLLHASLDRDKYYTDIRKERKKFYLLLRDTLAELQSMGKVNGQLNPTWAALQILGMIAWMTFWFDYKRKDQIDAILDSTVQMAFHGIGIF